MRYRFYGFLIVLFGIGFFLSTPFSAAPLRAETVRRVRTLLPEDSRPGRIAISPDGETLLVGGNFLRQYIDNVAHRSQIYLLDLKTGRPRWRINDLIDHHMIHVEWLPDGKCWVACWGEQKRQRFVILVGSYDDGNILHRWEIPDKSAGFATFTVLPDGKQIMLLDAFDLTKYLVVNVEDGMTKEIDKNETNFHRSAISRNGTLRLTGATGGRIILDEYPSGKNLWTVKLDKPPAGTAEYTTVGFLENDTKAIAFGRHKNPTIIFDVETGKEIGRIDEYFFDPYAVAVAPDGRFFITYSGGVLSTWTTLSEQDFPGDGLPSDHIFDGHKGLIQTLDLSQDGTRIASGSQDNTIKIWDSVTNKELRTLDEGDAAGWNAVKFSPDGSLVLGAGYSNEEDSRPELLRAAAIIGNAFVESPYWELYVGFTYSFDFTRGLVRLWNAETGEAIGRIAMPRRCWAADFTPDGRRFAVGSEDGKICIFDTDSRICVNAFELHYPVWSIAFDKSGKKLLVGTGTGESSWELLKKSYNVGRITDDYGAAMLLDAETGSELLRFEGHKHAVFTAAFSPDESMVLTGSRDNTARLWNATTGKELNRFENSRLPVRSVAFSKDGSRFVVGSYNDPYGIRIYDTKTGTPLYHAAIGSVLSVKFFRDDKSLLVGSGSRSFCSKDVSNMIDSRKEPLPDFQTVERLVNAGRERNQKEGIENPLEKLDIDKERQREAEEAVLARELRERADQRQGFKRVEEKIETRTPPEKDENLLGYVDWKDSNEGSLHCLFFGPDDTYLYAYGQRFHCFDWQSGKEISRWKNHAAPFVAGTDGRRILFGAGRFFSLYDTEQERLIRSFSVPDDGEEWYWWRNLGASDNGSLVIAAEDSLKNKIRLLNATTDQTVWEFLPGPGLYRVPSCYAIAPDNSKIAIGLLNGKILRVELDPIREKRLLKLPITPEILRFSPDGTKLLAVSTAGKTTLWNADTGKLFWKNDRGAKQVRFTPDGQKLVFAGHEQLVFLEAATGHLIGEQRLAQISDNNPIAFSSDGTKITYLDDGGYLRVVRVNIE